MSVKVAESIELSVIKKERRDTKSSTSTGNSTDATVVPKRPKRHKKPEDAGPPGVTKKLASWACPPWITCICLGAMTYATWNVTGGHRLVLTKVAISQLLTGLGAGGATYLGIFYISPGKYSLCIPVADHEFFLAYQAWYDAHKRPRKPEA